MSDLYNRISEILKSNHINGTQFAEILGLKKSPLTDWKNNKSKPTAEQIIKICDYFAISSDYLLLGNAFNNCHLSETDLLLLKIFHELPIEKRESCLSYIQGYADATKNLDKK